MNDKTDFLGNKLSVGDKVVFMQLGYRALMVGEITNMSEKKCTLIHEMTNTCRRKSIQFYNQMIRIND